MQPTCTRVAGPAARRAAGSVAGRCGSARRCRGGWGTARRCRPTRWPRVGARRRGIGDGAATRRAGRVGTSRSPRSLSGGPEVRSWRSVRRTRTVLALRSMSLSTSPSPSPSRSPHRASSPHKGCIGGALARPEDPLDVVSGQHGRGLAGLARDLGSRDGVGHDRPLASSVVQCGGPGPPSPRTREPAPRRAGVRRRAPRRPA